jgi:hypothetical protein
MAADVRLVGFRVPALTKQKLDNLCLIKSCTYGELFAERVNALVHDYDLLLEEMSLMPTENPGS